VNDNELLAAMRSSLTSVKDSLTDVHMERTASAITARARTRRVRRAVSRAGAAGLAISAGVALTLGSGGPATAGSVHVNLDAWSVNTNSSGLVDVTVRALKDPALLRQTLVRAGVPAEVTFGEVCTATTGDLPQLSQVLNKTSGGGDVVMTIDRAAMPAESELIIGVAEQPKGHSRGLVAGFGLIKDGARLACHAPHTGIGPGGVKTGVR
jgi:hypothetical protein